MQLKYLQTILESKELDSKIVALAWSANNQKLAVATIERQVLLFDSKGEKKGHFSTKPSVPENGKQSYVITGIAFGPDSIKLAVAQSDNVVYVYKLGDKWTDKKAICNKFPQSSPVTCLLWLSTGLIISGLSDGKVRALNPKSNKSHSLFASNSLVVSLCSNAKGTGFLSGHLDGNIVRFFVTTTNTQHEHDQVQGRVILYTVPPTALAWTPSHIFVGGCDNRITLYNNKGKTVKQFDYSKDDLNEHGFMQAASSPSGQAVIVGGYDRLRLFLWNSRKSVWEEGASKEIPNMYSVSALFWRKDGAKIACGTTCGAVILFESVLKRTVWKDLFELTYVGSSQIVVTHLHKSRSSDKDDGNREVIVKAQHGRDIEDVKIMGKDQYLVARTEDTLLIVDLNRNLSSEVPWNNPGKSEKFYFDYPMVCLVFNAGELALIEYGHDDILCCVRTEFVNPHLISVRLNERRTLTNNNNSGSLQNDNKKLAYLLDLKTICLIDLTTNSMIGQISHDSKIDWLELSETSHKLLFRDKKLRLLLVDTETQQKQCIFTGVSFVQWVEGSDVAVAQSDSNLALWYNIEMADNPTIMPIKGDVIDVVRRNGKTEAVCLIDGNTAINLELDEGLVEFGTAISDRDYGRAVLFLESLGSSAEAEAMWHNLAAIALQEHDLLLAARCHSALNDVAASHFLQETLEMANENNVNAIGNDEGEMSTMWARLAVFNGDLLTAEHIYVERGDIDKAIDMYKELHKWDEVIRLAEQRGYKHQELSRERMSVLLASRQYERVAELLEAEGKIEEALDMYMKANKLSRVPNLLARNPQLSADQQLMMTVLKSLIRHELFEAAAEIYEQMEKYDLAMECYRKGKVWNKAVDLARKVSPDKVVDLEAEWGDSLFESKQLDAAISHYIEAGCTLKALETAVAAKQFKKAVHIIQVVDDQSSVAEYYRIIAKHFANVQQEYSVAEKLLVHCGMYKEAVDMYTDAGLWERALRLASQHLDRDQVADMYMKKAAMLEESGRFRDAERLYLAVDSPDLAIAMYKKAEQYDHMIRLVEKYHPDLLHTTHVHLAQQLEAQGKYRAAEIHYLAVADWKAAMNMYRVLGMWEEAYRVAKQNGGGQTAANQVAFLWAHTLPIDSAIRLLNKYGILESSINYACETYQFQFAFQLCKNLPEKALEVHLKYAMALEDDGKFQQAESEFILAEKPKEAVLMYIHAKNWMNALRIAETHDASLVADVLQAQALQCFHDKQYAEFEVLLLRAQMPEAIVDKYKSAEMWIDALRVCKDYLPLNYPQLQAEYSQSHHHTMGNVSVETLLSRANEWTLAGQHKQAIDCLLQVTEDITEASIVRRALVRAGDMVNKFLFGQEALEVIKILAPRLVEIGEYSMAAQLYVSLDMMKEAIDIFVSAEDWPKARKLAKELDPAYMNYVDTKYKDRLLKKGDVEQLADVDIVGALDLLAEQGQWARCIEKAKSHSAPILHKYVALYAAKLLKDGFVKEALSLYASHGAPATNQNFNIYNLIATEIFALNHENQLDGNDGEQGKSNAEEFETWQQLRQMLYEINEGLNVGNVNMETKQHFRNLLLIAHYYTLRSACRQVTTLKSIAVQISTALLRYTDIIPADKAFYEAGKDLKAEGRLSEAFVFLNHYLDLCEAIEEGDGHLVDHSDLIQTDFPSNIPLPQRMYLSENPREHDAIREWILTVSMDQRVEQTLPLDERQLYASSLEPGEQPCIVSGYPVRKTPVHFGNSSTYQANRDVWSKLNIASKITPDSNLPSILSFIAKWCGPASNAF